MLMKVKFRVVEGPGAGREFRIPIPKCVIGRSQDCHLRLNSEAISRHHCVVHVCAGKVFVRDLKSRNGTYVNGRQVPRDGELVNGDELRLGPLVVQIHIDHERHAFPAATVHEAGATTACHPSEARCPSEDGAVADWVEQADAIAQAQRLGDPETRRFELKAANRPKAQPGRPERSEASPESSGSREEAATSSVAEERVARLRDHNRTPGKLPIPEEIPSKDSSEAAAKMLKRFFGGH